MKYNPRQTVILPWPASVTWPNSRAHFMRVATARKNQRDFAYWLAKSEGIKIPADVVLHVTFHPSRKRRFDLDNALAAIKADLDGLARASGVDDESWRFGIYKGEPIKDGAVVIEW